MSAKKILDVTRSQVGVREGRLSSGSWNNQVKYNDWYVEVTGHNWFRNAAWCAIFVSWVAAQAGVSTDVIPRHAGTPAGLEWFKKRGLVSQGRDPRPGDVFYVYYKSQGMVGHVGFVESVANGWVTTIEGNTNTTGSSQGNGVYRLRRRITSDLYFCHPKYAALPAASTPPPQPSPPLKPIAEKVATMVGAVSVKALKAARDADPSMTGSPLGVYANQVYTLETALAKTGWLDKRYVDGHYGTTTVAAVQGFQRKHSGSSKPDGWMGKLELGLLFRLAGMKIAVVD